MARPIQKDRGQVGTDPLLHLFHFTHVPPEAAHLSAPPTETERTGLVSLDVERYEAEAEGLLGCVTLDSQCSGLIESVACHLFTTVTVRGAAVRRRHGA